ncbi:hypothetical protein [Psychrobacillus phage Perkons]|nr:hypothetical protein [Psychrobacillus phage Perkons]
MNTEEIKPEYKVLLSEKYAIDTDKMNIVLKEKYQKKDGRGRTSNFIEEYGFRDIGYFGNLTQVANYIVKHELLKVEDISELSHFAKVIENLKDDIIDTLHDKVTVIK